MGDTKMMSTIDTGDGVKGADVANQPSNRGRGPESYQCGKRLPCKRKRGGVETTRSMAVSVVALMGAYLVAGRLALELLVFLGFLRMQNHILISLAALASLVFVACSQLLLRWAPTAALGKLLMDRIFNTRSNWETDTLRSFCEVGIWLCVVWSTFEASEGGISGCIAALLCGTIAGVLLASVGEALKAPFRKLETILRETPVDQGDQDESTLSLESGSMMLLALFGFSAVSTIYENVTDVVVACGLASLGGLGILTVAKVIQVWEPTRCIGITLQSRLFNTFENWRSYPTRSALESTFFAAVVTGMYTLHADKLFALQVGTLSGIAVIFTGELFEHGVMRHCGCRANKKQRRAEEKEQGQLVPPIVLAYGSFVLAVGFYAIRERQMLEAALSTIVNSICWVATASACVRCRSTSHAGTVINDRIIHAASNWVNLPLRSLLETSVWIGAQLTSFAATHSVLASALSGTVAGFFTVLLCEAIGWGHLPWQAIPVDGMQRKCTEKDTPQRSFTWAEVARHTNPEDSWLVIENKVYDISEWAPHHPGGSIIEKFAGVDASDQFAAFHRPHVKKRLERFLVGQVKDSEPSAFEPSGATLEYRALRERLWKEGYFQPRPEYFILKGSVCMVLMVVTIYLVFFLSPSWGWLRIVLSGISLGITLQQVAFITHDAAHNGVVDTVGNWDFNWIAWFLGSSIFGISSGMWTEEHSMHHAITLRPCEDPQFSYLPLWLISPKELDVPGVKIDLLTRVLVPVQHYTFLPIVLVVARFNLNLISVLWALKRLFTAPTPRAAFVGVMDLVGMAIHWAWFLTLVQQFDSLYAKAGFLLSTCVSCGILHVQLLLSHLATQTFTVEEERAEQFFSFQMKTTRNIDARWCDHWFHGGLEFQIEHHLFPQLPRHNLQKVQPFVQEICRRHGIPYRSSSFFGALEEIHCDLRHLSTIVHLKMG